MLQALLLVFELRVGGADARLGVLELVRQRLFALCVRACVCVCVCASLLSASHPALSPSFSLYTHIYTYIDKIYLLAVCIASRSLSTHTHTHTLIHVYTSLLSASHPACRPWRWRCSSLRRSVHAATSSVMALTLSEAFDTLLLLLLSVFSRSLRLLFACVCVCVCVCVYVCVCV